MTRSPRRFPIASRLPAAALPLAVVLTLSAAALAAPSHRDVVDARARVQADLHRVAGARAQLDALRLDLASATAQVDDTASKLEEITAHLLDTQRRAADAKLRYLNTVGRLNDRAVQAFIAGPGQDLDFLLGASSLADLSDRIEFVNAVAQSDADLAQAVRNTRTRLQASERTLATLQSRQQRLVQEAQTRRAAILDNFRQQQTLLGQIRRALSSAKRDAASVSKRYQAYVKAQAAQASSGGVHAAVPIPPGYEGVFRTCPVAQPRSFSDSFGAPRYAGGYHLHKGNDILAPIGTEIYAPFDGYARSDYNTLGGNAVFVSGAQGEVYNAHLSAFSSHSNGPVHAGDVIGYVGDTGDAIGIPHDHFEFHPAVMPSSWFTSPYGYSIIEDAVDPYPLLVAACG